MEVLVAKYRGFCYGVERAVNIVGQCENSSGKVATFGPIIHNPQVVERFRQKGIDVVEDLSAVKGGTVIIRSHGVGPAIYQQADEMNINVVDATCPHVRKAQQSAQKFVQEGRVVVVVGEKDHPEVKSIVAWALDKASVVETVEEAVSLPLDESVGIVSQTTFSPALFDKIVEIIKNKSIDVKVDKTICSATELRQQAAVELAGQVDVMVVVGGKNSANTARLAEICRQTGTKVYQVETAAELLPEWFEGVAKAGITAGASTPDWIIEEVSRRMQEHDKDLKQDEKEQQAKEEIKPLDNIFANADLTLDWVEEAFNKMKMYEHEYYEESAALEQGSIIKGRVVNVRPDEVFIDIGYKSEGIIPLAELAYPQPQNAMEVVKEGDIIDVYVDDPETGDGAVKLSKLKADNIVAWDKLQQCLDNNLMIEAKVTEVVKGGLTTSVFGIRGFIPASQIDLKFVEDLKEYVGQNVAVVPIEVDKDKKRVILSRRVLLEEERRAKEAAIYSSIVPGQTINGVVRRLADFGAFVDIGGVDGLVHISDLSWHRVKSPSEVVNVGDEVEVTVLKVDPQTKKISLSLKAVQRDPWFDVVDELGEGKNVKGKISKTTKFGAFVEIAPGVEGLVHLSELDDRRVNSADEVVNVGQEVVVKILSIDKKNKRISLSLSQAKQEAERNEYSRFLETEDKGMGVTIGDKLGHLFKRDN